MAKQSLLDIAKSNHHKDRRRNTITPEEIELAIAWMRDEVTVTQVGIAMKTSSVSNSYSRICIILREAYCEGVIRIVEE